MSETGQPGAATPGEHGDGTGQQDDLGRSGNGWAPPVANWSWGVDAAQDAGETWHPGQSPAGWADASPRYADLPAPAGAAVSPERAERVNGHQVNGHQVNGVHHAGESPAGRHAPVSAPPGLRESDHEAGNDRLVVPAPRPAPGGERPVSPAPGSPTSAPPAMQVPPVGTAASGFEMPPGLHAPGTERPVDEPTGPSRGWDEPTGPSHGWDEPPGPSHGWDEAYPSADLRPGAAATDRSAAEHPPADQRPAEPSAAEHERPSWARSGPPSDWAPAWARGEGEPAGRRSREAPAQTWAHEPSRPYEPVRAESTRPYEAVPVDRPRPYEPSRPESGPAPADPREPAAAAGPPWAATPTSAPPSTDRPAWATGQASAPPAADRPSWDAPVAAPASTDRPAWATAPAGAPPERPSWGSPPADAPPAERPSWAARSADEQPASGARPVSGAPGGERPSWARPVSAAPADEGLPWGTRATSQPPADERLPWALRPASSPPAGTSPTSAPPAVPEANPAPTVVDPVAGAAAGGPGRRERTPSAPVPTSAVPYAARRSASEPVPPAEPANGRSPDSTSAVLPQRVPAEPDVPVVPEPPAVEPPAETPELARIATHLRRDDEPAPLRERPEGFDVNAILDAVRGVEGVRDAALRRTPAGAHSLRLDLSDGADPAEVSRQVARLLQERMGLAAAPRGMPGTAAAPVRRRSSENRGGDVSAGEPRRPTNRPAGARAETVTARAEPVPENLRRRRPAPAPNRGRAVVEEVGPPGSPVTLGASYSGGQLTTTESAPSRPLDTGGAPGPRVVLDHVQVSTFGLDATVEVRLIAGEQSAAGYATGPAVDGYVMRLCAVAAAAAIDELLRGAGTTADRGRCFVEHAAVVPFGNCEVATVVVLLVCDGWVEQLAGSALVAGDPRQAVVRATLAAVNRRLEALLA
ncbi:hypothetical protein D2L64_23735 [Micromonospora radicis]|uniref:Uncharacterized protein n=1 Tax=Micromonospora radicis TaxID=1894971 RepID=A0A418MP35_9ACTN|nr:hypothetical protein [Micromonospora radicis]RIV34136.1 hypothetical protein D2L64_23735 [Micromonospora radicis]